VYNGITSEVRKEKKRKEKKRKEIEKKRKEKEKEKKRKEKGEKISFVLSIMLALGLHSSLLLPSLPLSLLPLSSLSSLSFFPLLSVFLSLLNFNFLSLFFPLSLSFSSTYDRQQRRK
jgi:hypothetical protein